MLHAIRTEITNMNKKEKELKKNLIEATKAVKRKFQELHSDKFKKIIKNQTNDNHSIEEK